MNQYKICVYAICKNEESFVERWMESMNEADMVIVTDTGSEDGTVEKLRNAGATVHVEEIKPWRFDVARNISLTHVPDDVDICVCTDLDEIFEKGWRAKLEKTWVKGTNMANYIYNWSLKEDGTPDIQFHYFKVHTKKDYKWLYPIHEALSYIGDGAEQKIFVEGMVLNHYPDTNKSRGTYLPLLELAAAESPEDDRVTYYLGREYMYAGEWEKSIQTLKKHLALPSAWWKEERCASMRWIAKCYKNTGNNKEALNWYLRAVAEVPGMRDSYVECARLAYDTADWALGFFMAEKALEIKEKSVTYVNMGYSWDETPYDLSAICSYNMGLYEKSLTREKEALAMAPNNQRLKENVRIIESKVH